MTNLIKGIIYEDAIDVENEHERIFDMIESIDDLHNKKPGFKDELILYSSEEFGKSYDEMKNMYKNVDAIAAITGFNVNTGETSNMIIPKEAVSPELQRILSVVDIAPDMPDAYIKHFAKKYLDVVETKKEETTKFTVEVPKNSEIEELLLNNPLYKKVE